MSPVRHGVEPPGPSALGPERRNAGLRQGWGVITTVLVVATFSEAAFAGAMLSGADWARPAHAINALVLIATTLCAGLAAAITLRRVVHGTRLATTLLGLAAVILMQTALGRFSANGANLLWLHVPLGVALVGFAAQAATAARQLGAGGETAS